LHFAINETLTERPQAGRIRAIDNGKKWSPDAGQLSNPEPDGRHGGASGSKYAAGTAAMGG